MKLKNLEDIPRNRPAIRFGWEMFYKKQNAWIQLQSIIEKENLENLSQNHCINVQKGHEATCVISKSVFFGSDMF